MFSISIGRALFPCVFFLLAGHTRAETPASQPSAQADWPQKVTVTVGDIRTRIEEAKLWTLSGIDFQNTVMATEESAYGTVITIRGVGHLGTAHFLDVPGKPGEIEKENVTSLQFFVDGKAVKDFTPTMNLSGTTFRMERRSKIRALDLESTVLIQEGVLIETQHWHATKAIDLRMSYPLMYAWTPAATHFAVGDDSGILQRGVFRKEGKGDDGGLNKTARWMAVFDAANGRGSVCYLLKHPADADGWLQWSDAPGIYRKLRIMTFVEKIVPEGFEGTYQSAVGFFSATEADWEQQAQRRAEELKTSGARQF